MSKLSADQAAACLRELRHDDVFILFNIFYDCFLKICI